MARKRGEQKKRLGNADPEWQRKTREKIQTSQILNRLNKHVAGTVEMTSSQVRAAEVLLNRVLPILSATSLTGADGEGPVKVDGKLEIVFVDAETKD